MLKEIKFYFENLFATKWTNTAIHFSGQEFEPKGLASWVNPTYSPTRRRSFGLGGNANTQYGDLYVVCWSDNDVNTMELADKVSAFIDTEVDGTLFRIMGYEVLDHGWDSTNKAFIMLSFPIKTIGGECDLKKKNIVINKGTPVVNGGNPVTN